MLEKMHKKQPSQECLKVNFSRANFRLINIALYIVRLVILSKIRFPL